MNLRQAIQIMRLITGHGSDATLKMELAWDKTAVNKGLRRVVSSRSAHRPAGDFPDSIRAWLARVLRDIHADIYVLNSGIADHKKVLSG